MRTADLSNGQLDFWVGKADKENIGVYGANGRCILIDSYGDSYSYSPSTDWSQGGPIIERERICVSGPGPMGGPNPDRYWTAYIDTGSYAGGGYNGHGRTPLIAAMRCFVASKFGEEVDDSQAHHI